MLGIRLLVTLLCCPPVWLGSFCIRRPSSVFLADSQVSYKNQLQIYLQKKNKGLPSYFSVHDGSPIRHFKAIVKIDGQSFESTGYFHTIKEAEQSAAMVALMSLFPKGNEQASNGLFLVHPSILICVLNCFVVFCRMMLFTRTLCKNWHRNMGFPCQNIPQPAMTKVIFLPFHLQWKLKVNFLKEMLQKPRNRQRWMLQRSLGLTLRKVS